MNDKNIKDAIDAIQPEPGAKERMYQNIRKKARQAAPAQPKRSPHRFVRYALPIAACFCLLAVGAVRLLPAARRCSPAKATYKAETPLWRWKTPTLSRRFPSRWTPRKTPGRSPMRSSTGKSPKSGLSWTEKATWPGPRLRRGTSPGSTGRRPGAETVDAKRNAVLVQVDTGIEIYQKITWTNGKINYCLYGDDGADKDQVLAVYEALKK